MAMVIRQRIQHLAEVADLVEFPGDFSVQKIRYTGGSYGDDCPKIMVLQKQYQKDRDQDNTDE